MVYEGVYLGPSQAMFTASIAGSSLLLASTPYIFTKVRETIRNHPLIYVIRKIDEDSVERGNRSSWDELEDEIHESIVKWIVPAINSSIINFILSALAIFCFWITLNEYWFFFSLIIQIGALLCFLAIMLFISVIVPQWFSSSEEKPREYDYQFNSDTKYSYVGVSFESSESDITQKDSSEYQFVNP